MKQHAEWIALSYSVPASPSKARVFVWRRLRTLGAISLRPGLAVLPFGDEEARQLDDLAEKIRELSGESLLLEMTLIDEQENARLRARFADAGQKALYKTIKECAALIERLDAAEPAERAQLERSLSKKLEQFKGRDSNPLTVQISELERTAGSLFGALRGLPSEFYSMLRREIQGGKDE